MITITNYHDNNVLYIRLQWCWGENYAGDKHKFPGSGKKYFSMLSMVHSMVWNCGTCEKISKLNAPQSKSFKYSYCSIYHCANTKYLSRLPLVFPSWKNVVCWVRENNGCLTDNWKAKWSTSIKIIHIR